MLGVPVEMARDPRTGSYIGRLFLFGRGEGLSRDQYDAAIQFLRLHNDWRKVIGSPEAHYEQRATVDAVDPDKYEAWAAHTLKEYEAVKEAIQREQMQLRGENLWAALQYVVIRDMELPHLIGPTRIVCNALHRHFTSAKRVRRAA